MWLTCESRDGVIDLRHSSRQNSGVNHIMKSRQKYINKIKKESKNEQNLLKQIYNTKIKNY